MIQPIAIRGDGGHINVARQPVAQRMDRPLNMLHGGAAFPIVGIIENYLKPAALQRFLHRADIISVGLDIVYLLAVAVLRLPVQHRNIVTGLHQFRDQQLANKRGSANYQDSHLFVCRPALIVIFHSQMGNQLFAFHPA